jgi:pyridoxamine 5'-phosphate oxidase
MKLHHLRQQYTKQQLNETSIPDDPFVLFKSWFSKALETSDYEAYAFVLSTVSNNRPSSRVVLLKEVQEQGFVFFSNYMSRKGKELQINPIGSMLFFWPELEQQIRIEGKIHTIDAESSDAYFNSRPVESQLSAIVSRQSNVIASKSELLDKIEAYYKNPTPLKRPDHWGGYLLTADYFEFWQGGENRLHDRFSFSLNGSVWERKRLSP